MNLRTRNSMLFWLASAAILTVSHAALAAASNRPHLLRIANDICSYNPFDNGLEAFHQNDYVTALRCWLPIARKGNDLAEELVGIIYEHGGGGVAQSNKEAMVWFKKAAYQGSPVANYELGRMYRDGQGVPPNFEKAVEFYRASAAHGYASAEYDLGVFYYDGQHFSRDFATARGLFQKAADQGHALAQHNLGVMYQNGEDVNQDAVTALTWYTLAVNNLTMSQSNYKSAAEADRDHLTALLSPSERAEVQRRVERWKPIKASPKSE